MNSIHAQHRRTPGDGHERAQIVAEHPLDLAVVHALAARDATLTVSLYLPTECLTWNQQDGRTRLRHLIDGAHRTITEAVSARKADAILAPVRALEENLAFWAHPQEAVAFFCDSHGVQALWLPIAVPERVDVSSSCHIKPLVPILHGDGYFYLLELAAAGVQLFKGTRSGVHALTTTPGVMRMVDPGCTAEGGPSGPMRMLHDAGLQVAQLMADGGEDQTTEQILQLYRRIDACVDQALHAQHAPLVLAGTERLVQLYRSVSSYPHVMHSHLTYHPDHAHQEAIHERAWAIVAPHFHAAENHARRRCAALSETDLLAHDLHTVLHALTLGQVGHLVVSSDSERWGTYDTVHDVIREHAPPWPVDDDLLNIAVIRAMANRASVQVVPRHDVPGGGDLAALFHW